MYENYWQLEGKPFEPTTNPRFVFNCPGHQAAIHKLRYAIESRRPAALLIGQAGIGKTLAWQALSTQLAGVIGKQVHIIFPLLSPREMLTYLAQELGAAVTSAQPTTNESLAALHSTLLDNHARGKLAVVAVDEAQLLEDAGLLDSLRLLMNLRIGGEPLFTLLLIGQTATLSTMERYNNLDERLELKVQLKPFTSDETAGYIEHRLVTAGAIRPLFTPQALEMAHQLTSGIPRRINRLCDLALMVGFAAQHSEIDTPQLQAVHRELVTLSAAA
jgi:general secretion pathway protein A